MTLQRFRTSFWLSLALISTGCGTEDRIGDESAVRNEAPPPIEVVADGVRSPRVVAAADADLDDDAIVIGVTVGDTHRAYWLGAFRPPSDFSLERIQEPDMAAKLGVHVVNDIVGETPVTVTYCNRTHCSRVLTESDRSEPLDVGVGGWREGNMLLLIDGERVPQFSIQMPLGDLDHQIATWKEWRDKYPTTDVYVGPE
jgi:hypothetical protein